MSVIWLGNSLNPFLFVGVIYENYLKGRKRALWISVSNDLKYDAERDLADIGNTGIEVGKRPVPPGCESGSAVVLEAGSGSALVFEAVSGCALV